MGGGGGESNVCCVQIKGRGPLKIKPMKLYVGYMYTCTFVNNTYLSVQAMPFSTSVTSGALDGGGTNFTCPF